MNRKMQEFQQKMNEQEKNAQNQPNYQSQVHPKQKPKDEDYIDFEEIK